MAYLGIYVGKNVEEINKYAPGKCKFSVPQLMDSDGTEAPTISKIKNDKTNLQNKDSSGIDPTYTEVSTYIDIEVPLEHTIFFPTKIIPKLTVFWVMFVGGDINKPVIIGRDINGYYS